MGSPAKLVLTRRSSHVTHFTRIRFRQPRARLPTQSEPNVLMGVRQACCGTSIRHEQPRESLTENASRTVGLGAAKAADNETQDKGPIVAG